MMLTVDSPLELVMLELWQHAALCQLQDVS